MKCNYMNVFNFVGFIGKIDLPQKVQQDMCFLSANVVIYYHMPTWFPGRTKLKTTIEISSNYWQCLSVLEY